MTKWWVYSQWYMLICFGSYSQNLSQNLISSSGNYFSSGNYNLCWSIGESVTATHSAGTSKLTQGFHQPPIRVTSVGENENSYFKIYPNPTSEHVVIESMNKAEEIEYFLTDLTGRKLFYRNLQMVGKIILDLSHYSSGFYFLNLKQKDKKEFLRFKIQKID